MPSRRFGGTWTIFVLLQLVACGCLTGSHDCPTPPTEPIGAGARTELISPWRGGSTQLPAGGTSAGPLLQANQAWFVPIDVNVGERLNALAFRVFGDGSVDVSFGLFLFDYSSNMNTLVTSGIVTNVPATWTETPLAISVPVSSEQALIFFFQPNAANAFAGLIFANVGSQ